MTETETGYVPGAPDITVAEKGQMCVSDHGGWFGALLWKCTRPKDHPMPHAAGTGSRIVATWDDNGAFAQVDIP